jgi:hypothetical protein
MKFRRLVGAAVAGMALASVATAPANAQVLKTMDFVVSDDHVEMVVFGSGTHVDSVTINSVGDFQGPAQYQFTYYSTTSPTKSSTIICGGGGTGDGCTKKFTINATYSRGVGIRSCGSIKRVDNQQEMGTACKTW